MALAYIGALALERAEYLLNVTANFAHILTISLLIQKGR
jgi:hypothetical protein